MTYRTGNHQPQNLYRGDAYIGVCFDPAEAALIVDALEGHTPDVDHTRGAAEALAAIRRRLTHNGVLYPGDAMLLQDVAAELGVDGDAPSRPLSAPVAAREAPVGGSGRPGGVGTIPGPCSCGHEKLPGQWHSRPCPIAEARAIWRQRCICQTAVDVQCPRHGAVI